MRPTDKNVAHHKSTVYMLFTLYMTAVYLSVHGIFMCMWFIYLYTVYLFVALYSSVCKYIYLYVMYLPVCGAFICQLCICMSAVCLSVYDVKCLYRCSNGVLTYRWNHQLMKNHMRFVTPHSHIGSTFFSLSSSKISCFMCIRRVLAYPLDVLQVCRYA